MTKIIDATFDGSVFRPAEPVPLQANTPVRLTIETLTAQPKNEASFLDIVSSLHLDGPPDWAANVDKYLYAEEPQSDQ